MTRHLILPAVAAALVLVACGSSGGTGHPPATHSVAAASPAAPVATSAPPSCTDQMVAWRTTALPGLETVSKDLGRASAAGTGGNLGALQGAHVRLADDAQTALTQLPPSCVPNLRTDEAIAMHDFIAAAASVEQGTIGGIQTANTQIRAGSAALVRATRDLSRWERSTGS